MRLNYAWYKVFSKGPVFIVENTLLMLSLNSYFNFKILMR